MARGPGWYSPAELKERLFTNKSKGPGDDLKEALRTDDDTLAWQAWHVAHDLIWQCCRPGPPLVFPGEKELIRAMPDVSAGHPKTCHAQERAARSHVA